MILDELLLMPDIPDDLWVTRLRRGHFVWAPKECVFAKVAFAMEPPNPG
jgi:hypothetical protein